MLLLLKARKPYTDSLGRTWKWNGVKYVYQRKGKKRKQQLPVSSGVNYTRAAGRALDAWLSGGSYIGWIRSDVRDFLHGKTPGNAYLSPMEVKDFLSLVQPVDAGELYRGVRGLHARKLRAAKKGDTVRLTLGSFSKSKKAAADFGDRTLLRLVGPVKGIDLTLPMYSYRVKTKYVLGSEKEVIVYGAKLRVVGKPVTAPVQGHAHVIIPVKVVS